MSACVVTDKIDFPVEPNSPPFIASAPGAALPLDKLAMIDLSQPSELQGSATKELTFQVIVSDQNVSQILSSIILVNTRIAGTQIIPISNSVERAFDFILGSEWFVPPDVGSKTGICYKVQLFVSGQFQNNVQPVVQGDLGTATWWVGVVSDSLQTVDIRSCP